MKIGVVTTSYPRSPDDFSGSFVRSHAHWLNRTGNEVEVIAAGPGCEFDGRIRVRRIVAGARLFYGEGAPDRIERSPWALRDAPLFSTALAAKVATVSSGWDSAISHWLVPSGLITALAFTGPHLAIAHSGDVHLVARPWIADLLGLVLATRQVRVAFVTSELRARFMGALRTRTVRQAIESSSFVCPMGIDTSVFRCTQDRATAKRNLGLPLDLPVVAFVGRLVPIKGCDILVEAVAQLTTPAFLAIAGDGPEEARLRHLAAERGIEHRLLGTVDHRRKMALLAAADLLVVPSVNLRSGRTEGAPLIVLEALAAGVPLIASDVGGVAEITRGAARLVSPGNDCALARAIGEMLAKKEDYPALGRIAAKRFDWELLGPALHAKVAGDRASSYIPYEPRINGSLHET